MRVGSLPCTAEERRMARFLLVCLGGALGTGARYLITGWVPKLLGASFPYGTLTVNVLGSFLITLIMSVALDTGALSPTVRLFLTTGVMGGFTTFSTFTYENMAFLQERAWLSLALNLFVTVAACLLAGILGLITARALLGS
jgi:CrcB protein